MSSFFVAGTDTDVGKTTACRAIIQALQAKGVRIVGYKPIACSCEEGIYPVENQSNESQTDYDAENNLLMRLIVISSKPVGLASSWCVVNVFDKILPSRYVLKGDE